MKSQIFINLPVKDLAKSKEFYGRIGFTNNPQFTDNTAACMVLSDEIFVMLLTHEKFSEFSTKPVADSSATTGVINSISVGSVEEVNSTIQKVLDAGGVEPVPSKDYGFMWQRSFLDPDGHHWEIFYMDINKFPQQ